MKTDRRGFLGAIAAAIVTSALPIAVRAAVARVTPPTWMYPIETVSATADTSYIFTADMQIQRGQFALALSFLDGAGKVLRRDVGDLNAGKVVGRAPANATQVDVAIAAWSDSDNLAFFMRPTLEANFRPQRIRPRGPEWFEAHGTPEPFDSRG